jgi:hypothetical protein
VIDKKKKPPVVILISDKNSSDMDGTIGKAGNTPLRDVAHGLAKRGIASIRYNKRAYQYPDTASAEAGIREYLIKDAWMSIDSASYLNKIDTDAIYVMAWGDAAEYLPVIIDRRIRRIRGLIMVGAKPAKHMDMGYIDEATKIESDAKYFSPGSSSIPIMFLQGDKDFETPLKYFEKWQALLKGRAGTAVGTVFLFGPCHGRDLPFEGILPFFDDHAGAELPLNGNVGQQDIARKILFQEQPDIFRVVPEIGQPAFAGEPGKFRGKKVPAVRYFGGESPADGLQALVQRAFGRFSSDPHSVVGDRDKNAVRLGERPEDDDR